MNIEDEAENCYLLDHDPRLLLPYERELEPHDPNVEVLPKQYIGTDRKTYGDIY